MTQAGSSPGASDAPRTDAPRTDAMTQSVSADPARPVDVTAWVGGLPYRDVPHPDPDILVRVLDREGFGGAWVGHLPSVGTRTPAEGNRALVAVLAPYREVLQPVCTVRVGADGWEQELAAAAELGAPAVRVYPGALPAAPSPRAWRELAHACALHGLVLQVTLQLEEDGGRSRDIGAGEASDIVQVCAQPLPGQRAPVVLVSGATGPVIHACEDALRAGGRELVHYDVHWLAGPPGMSFTELVRRVGTQRLAVSSWWPLRLTQHARSLVELGLAEVVGAAGLVGDGRNLAAQARECRLMAQEKRTHA